MSGRAAILMYHIVDTPASRREARYCCLPVSFAEQMAWLRDACHPISLDQLLAAQQTRTPLPENAVAVTFDDGFAGTFENAMPELERYAIPATMYIVTNRIGGSNDWMHSRGMPQRTLVDAGQIREMHTAGITIGSHTLNHIRLPEIDMVQMRAEIGESKIQLEELLAAPVQYFAYPYGLYTKAAKSMVMEAGYAAACSTRSGFNNLTTDRYLWRRIEVFDTDRLWHFKQKLRFGTNDAGWLLPLKYYGSRLRARIAWHK